MLRITQRRCLGVDRIRLLADIRIAKDAKALGIRRHDAVFDSVVDHLHEMPRAVWAAVKIALLGSSAELFTTRCAWNFAFARREGRENWIEPLYDFVFASDHHAIAALKAPHATAGSYIYIMDALGAKLCCSANVVHVIRVAAVDDDVVAFQMGKQILDGRVHDGRRHHQPDCSWPCEILHHLPE